jgi:hypothetical protein
MATLAFVHAFASQGYGAAHEIIWRVDHERASMIEDKFL